ncbi:MAG TPA: indole-3-glycerol phosphate synthase TrpC [bacterium]|nr:indole-3-glycerol phosphate synthase TrpC [bacterium]
MLREDFQPLRIASLYETGGAAAISVLTETHFFKGRPSYLRTVREVTSLPLLRKDFILETYQLYESVLLEADAFLLIASILTAEELKSLIELGHELRMDALVEVHTDEDLKKAIDAGAKIIGVNNRNLRTLEVDPLRAKQLIPHIPKGMPVVIESGLSTYEELMEYKSLGINAFLIGTALMKSQDILGTLNELLGRDKKWRRPAEEPQ